MTHLTFIDREPVFQKSIIYIEVENIRLLKLGDKHHYIHFCARDIVNIIIEVRPMRADEDFTFGDLELFHQDCGGGVITKKEDKNHGWWNFKCNRCGANGTIYVDHKGTIGLIQTAIDGKTRQVSLSSTSDYYQAVQRKE